MVIAITALFVEIYWGHTLFTNKNFTIIAFQKKQTMKRA
jgi:hypothetical protein